jgi:hypothetical protein
MITSATRTPPSSGAQHLHFGTSMPSGGVHPIIKSRMVSDLIKVRFGKLSSIMAGGHCGDVAEMNGVDATKFLVRTYHRKNQPFGRRGVRDRRCGVRDAKRASSAGCGAGGDSGRAIRRAADRERAEGATGPPSRHRTCELLEEVRPTICSRKSRSRAAHARCSPANQCHEWWDRACTNVLAQLHVAISKGGLLELGDRHGGHLFQPCDQIEIMAMARRAAVRDRDAMWKTLGSPVLTPEVQKKLGSTRTWNQSSINKEILQGFHRPSVLSVRLRLLQ